jgi:hypothetical protein
MRIPARELAVGDVIRLNDWRLHVVAVEHDLATAVLTAEFDFLLHFTRTDPVDVVAEVHDPSAAARRAWYQSSPNSSRPFGRAPISAHNDDASRDSRAATSRQIRRSGGNARCVPQRHRARHTE